MRKGQHHTKKSREKMKVTWTGAPKPWLQGRKLSIERRKQLSDIHKKLGDRPPSRRGTIPWNYRGVTKLTEQIRKCFEYRQWRSDVFTRDNFICQHCGMRGEKLNADHIKEFSKIMEEHKIRTLEDALNCSEMWNINNGRTLCVLCHKSRKKWDREEVLIEEL